MKIFVLITVIFSILLQNEAHKFGISQTKEIQPKFGVKNTQPRMTFIGQINGKNFFYDEIEVNRDGARTACSNAGMELAYFDASNEFEFISSIGPIELFWTSAIHPNNLGYFTWEHDAGSEIPSQNFAYFSDTELGLTFFSSPEPDRNLTQTLRSQIAYPLCIARAKNGNIVPKAASKFANKNPKITKEKIIPKRPAFESGPLPVSVKLANHRIEFIGEFNGRNFYYDPQLVSRNESKISCQVAGMQLAYFESLAEIEYIFVNTPQNYFWVSGIKRWEDSSLSYFNWENSGSIVPANIPFNAFADTSFGLLFSGYLEEFPRHFIQTKLGYANAVPLCFIQG